jgi:hypothetical protein
VATADFTLVNDGGSYEAAEGTNRLIVIAISRESTTGTRTLTAMSLGASSIANGRIVPAVISAKTAASPRGTANIYYILETNIESGAQAISVTWSGAMEGSNQIGCYTLTGRDQTSPIDSTTSLVLDVLTDPWTLALSVGTSGADLVMAAWNSSNSLFAPPASWAWVEDHDLADTGYVPWYGHLDNASSGSTDCTLDLPTARQGSVAVAAFAATTATTVSRLTLLGVG